MVCEQAGSYIISSLLLRRCTSNILKNTDDASDYGNHSDKSETIFMKLYVSIKFLL